MPTFTAAFPNVRNDVIDRYFGPIQGDDASVAVYEVYTDLRHFSNAYHSQYAAWSNDEGYWIRLEVLEKLWADLEAALKDIARGREIDRDKFRNVLAVAALASKTLEVQVRLMDTINGSTIASGLFGYIGYIGPRSDMLKLHKAYEKELLALQRALEQAKKNRVGAYIGKALDAVNLAVTIAGVELKIAATIALKIAEVANDAFVKTDKPENTSSKIKKGTDKILQSEKIIERLTELSGREKVLFAAAGKLDDVIDAVNFSDIKEAHQEVDNLKAAIKEWKAAKAAMIAEVQQGWRLKLAQFQKSQEASLAEIKQLRETVSEGVGFANELMAAYRIRPGNVNWRMQ